MPFWTRRAQRWFRMRILLDESVPRRLGKFLVGHHSITVQRGGWAGIDNGKLLRLETTSREALQWLWRLAWIDRDRVRIDVLLGNAGAREFWRAVGFDEYCVTMESQRPSSPLP